MFQIPKLKELSFLVYGLGISGRSVISFIKKNNHKNFKVWDDINNKIHQKLRPKNLNQALKEVDYIRTRVFPGSCVPSASAMIQAAVKNSNLRPANLYDFGYHYSRTLREWRLRFLENEEKIKKLGYNDHFRRAWIYYLCYCEAGFEEGYTGDIHLLLAKPECMLGRGFTG